MLHHRRIVPALALVTAGLVSVPATAGDSIDTRVTFTIADDDVARGPTESTTGSPSIPNSQPTTKNNLFFDNFDRRDPGFENLTHLVLYAHQPGFFRDLDTEAALVIRAETLDEKGMKLGDDGSYIKLAQALESGSKLALTAFPVSADRLRLGYAYQISWGGTPIFKNAKAAPGLRLELTGANYYAWLGMKTARAQQRMDDATTEMDTVWGVMGGVGLDIVDEVRLEGGAGYFKRGTIDKEQLQVPTGDGRVKTAPWLGYGASTQLTYHVGIPIGTPVDFKLYKNDPLKAESFFRPEVYGDGVSFSLKAETSVLGQTLQDPDRMTSTVNQTAMASALTALVKIDRLRLHGLAVLRNLAFVLYNVPSQSFSDFPAGIATFPEYFLAGGADYYVEDLHLTPGVVLGIQRPAHFTGVRDTGASQTDINGPQTFIYRNDIDVEILNPGEKVVPIFAAKATAKLDLSEAVQAAGELQLSYDKNRRRLVGDPSGINVYQPLDNPTIVGFYLMLRARF